MKILLDIQGAQCQSRHRGIGRYSLALARAFAELVEDRHRLHVAFNARLDANTDALIAELGRYAGFDRRVMLKSLPGVAGQHVGNEAIRQANELVYGYGLERQRADLVWFSSMVEGYVDDAVLPPMPLGKSATVATLYDLIPLHDPQAYLDHPRMKAWYQARMKALADCDLLLAISQWVRADAMDRLGLPAENVVTIGAGVDPRFHPTGMAAAGRNELLRRHAIVKSYLLYNGGYDARKNVAALIQAYATLPPAMRDAHQLVLVGRLTDEQAATLKTTIRRARLDPAAIVFAGYVADEDLIGLYCACTLFVFPSLLEGFGLPPLEAMACGAPVIGSDAASLPEVIGSADALFDGRHPQRIGERMAMVLSQPGLATKLREHGLRQASQFTWPKVAGRALDAIEALHARKRARPGSNARARPRLLCLVAISDEYPPWLHELERGYQWTQQQLAEAESETLRSAERILYLIDEKALEPTRRMLVQWPGTVLLHTSTAPSAWPEPSLFQRYRLHGYAGLAAAPDAPPWRGAMDVTQLLGQNCLGIILACTGIDIVEPSANRTTCPLAALPGTDRAAFCASHIETWHAELPLAQETRLLDRLSQQAAGDLDEDAVAMLSDAIASARRAYDRPQWLIDVTEISRKDIGTGVQRVVRSILAHWLRQAPGRLRVEPVAFVDGRYRYARSYALGLLGRSHEGFEDDLVEATPGDTFIGLDWAAESLSAREPQLRAWRRLGVDLHFVVHDLLPLSLPETFHPYAREFFLDWLGRACTIADRLHCVSRTTADELSAWLAQGKLDYQFGRPPQVSSFILGIDPRPPIAAGELPPDLARATHDRSSLLMVGTIEPRKAHVQALDALERLWQQGVDLNLIIVGHHGWLMEAFIERLEKHPERHQRLFWLGRVDDGTLEALYRTSTALLAASLGEGFGLPLIEAARHGLPVIARDLPVFREVMGDYPYYFDTTDAGGLAEAIRNWLAAPSAQKTVDTWPNWAQSAAALARAVADHHPRQDHARIERS